MSSMLLHPKLTRGKNRRVQGAGRVWTSVVLAVKHSDLIMCTENQLHFFSKNNEIKLDHLEQKTISRFKKSISAYKYINLLMYEDSLKAERLKLCSQPVDPHSAAVLDGYLW